MLSGLHLAGSDLKDQHELDHAFYAHLFRKSGSLAATDSYRPEDISPEEAPLLNLLWQAAADVEHLLTRQVGWILHMCWREDPAPAGELLRLLR